MAKGSAYDNYLAGHGEVMINGVLHQNYTGKAIGTPTKNTGDAYKNFLAGNGTIQVGGQTVTRYGGNQPTAAGGSATANVYDNIGSSVNSTSNVNGYGNIQDIADPFHTQRAQYQSKLSSLISDPNSFLSSPLAQSMNEQGLQAINRTAAAKKQLGSGNRLADLMKYGQGNAAGQYFNQANLLAGLSGAAPGSPAAAASNTVSLANLASGQNMYQTEQDKARKAIEDANWQDAYTNLYKNFSMF